MKQRAAPVVSLAAARARRREASPPTPPPAHLTVRSGVVVLVLGGYGELELSPEHARVWAEKLAAMAARAESRGGDGSV